MKFFEKDYRDLIYDFWASITLFLMGIAYSYYGCDLVTLGSELFVSVSSVLKIVFIFALSIICIIFGVYDIKKLKVNKDTSD